jgi:hypothetical protein
MSPPWPKSAPGGPGAKNHQIELGKHVNALTYQRRELERASRFDQRDLALFDFGPQPCSEVNEWRLLPKALKLGVKVPAQLLLVLRTSEEPRLSQHGRCR